MIDFLDQNSSLNSIIWLFIIVFMLHDFEEIIGIEPWMKKNHSLVIKRTPARFKNVVDRLCKMKSYQFAVAVLLEFVIFIPITFIAAEQGRYLFFLAFNAIFLLHVLTHLGQSLILRKYTVGVGSAVFLVLPYTIYLFYRLTNEGEVTWNQILISAPLGLIILPIVLFGHELGRRLLK